MFIGFEAGTPEIESNRLYIENSNADRQNALIYGDFAADSLVLNGKTINRNLFAVRGAGANTGIEIGYGVFLKDPSAGRIGYGLATANTIDFYGGGSSVSTRAIKFWAEGGSSFTGPINVDGFTRLGTVADAAPKVKMKKLIVTGPAVNALTSFPTGISDTKILGVNIFMTYSSTWKMPPNYTDTPGYEYNYQVQNGNVVIINKSGNSANIGTKPITILITYEE